MIIATVFRTLFYQVLLLFVGCSIGFILNAEWVGIKSLILERSMSNIFFPTEYDEQMERWVKGWGSFKVYSLKNQPDEFEVIDENVYYNEEWYWCRFKYRDKDGKIKFDEGTTRVRWKTWEYYYDHEVIDTPEKVREQIKKDKEQIEERRKEVEEAKKKEEEILKEDKVNNQNLT